MVRLSSDAVGVLLSCVGAASTVKRIAHSAIKIVVNLYILAVKEKNRYTEARRLEWSLANTSADVQSRGLIYVKAGRYLTCTPDMP